MSLLTLGAFTLLALQIALSACTARPALRPPAAAVTAPPPAASGTIVLGEVSAEPSAKHRLYQPLADYLAARLGDFGVGTGEVRIVSSLDTAAQLMKAGEIDLYFDSPYPAMIVTDRSGAQPIMRRWKGGEAEYFSLLFSRADSDVRTPSDLKGRVLGVENTYSTSGFLLPLTYLRQLGLSPAERSDPASSVGEGEVGYVFTMDEKNTIQWVLSGRVAAGAVDSRSFLKIPDEGRAALRVLAESEKVARALVLARPGLDPALLASLKTTLSDMEYSPEGQDVLKNFESTTRFDEFPSQSTLERMRELYSMMPRN